MKLCYLLLDLKLSLFSDTVNGVMAGQSLFYHLTSTALWVIKMETFVLLEHSFTVLFHVNRLHPVTSALWLAQEELNRCYAVPKWQFI
jgi:hypothetical protein